MLPDGSAIYMPTGSDGTVLVIDTGTNTVTATVPVGEGPVDSSGGAAGWVGGLRRQ